MTIPIIVLIIFAILIYFSNKRNYKSIDNTLGDIDTALDVSGKPYQLSVAQGEVAGTETLYKFGYNSEIQTTEETIWDQGGNITWLSAATTVHVNSTVATDTTTGTGVRKIRVIGLDANYNDLSEDFDMNGRTQVQGEKEFYRIFRAFALESGSDEVTSGSIYVANSSGLNGDFVPTGTILAKFNSDGQTQMAVYTVAAGKTFYMDRLSFTAGVSQANRYVTIKFRVRYFGTSTWRTQFIHALQSNLHATEFDYPRSFPERTDIECRAVADQSTSNGYEVSASFAGILVNN